MATPGGLNRRKSRADRQLEQQQALEMRRLGATYVQIGAALGISDETASRRVHTALSLLVAEEAEAMRALIEDRFDALLRESFKRLAYVPEPNHNEAAALMAVVLRTEAQRARLFGLNLDSSTTQALEGGFQ